MPRGGRGPARGRPAEGLVGVLGVWAPQDLPSQHEHQSKQEHQSTFYARYGIRVPN